MTQPQKRPRHAGGDEGAAQTKQIMEAVKSARLAKKPPWSAARLADEMAKAGVGWDRNVVANLESGRRRSLKVHELLTLAWVLDTENPLDLMVPEIPKLPVYPVTPSTLLSRAAVRAWFRGETGPLREWLDAPREDDTEDLAELIRSMEPGEREQYLRMLRSTQPSRPPARQEQSTDGKS